MFLSPALFGSHGMIELYRGYLKPRGESVSEAHRPGMTGFATVMSGCLAVVVDGETCAWRNTIPLQGGRPHPELQPFFFPDDHAYFLQPALNGMGLYAGNAPRPRKKGLPLLRPSRAASSFPVRGEAAEVFSRSFGAGRPPDRQISLYKEKNI